MELNLLNHDVRKNIFKKLMYASGLSFSQLQDSNIRSNHFNYHLNKLVKLGIIKKDEDGLYSLTNTGNELAIYVDLNDMGVHKQPFVIAGVIIREEGKILLSRLEREPFKGVWATSVVGRVRFGEGIKESAVRQTIERTGYVPKDLKLKIIYSMRTYNKDDIHSHHLFYVFKCNEFAGELKKKTVDRLNKWFNIKNLEKLNIFADIPYSLKYIDKRGINFFEITREFDGKKFDLTRILN